MVEYLDGGRIQGTSTANLQVGTYAGWKEVGRTTLSSAGDVIDVGSLPNKRYYMVIRNIIGGDGNMAVYNRLNGDTGSNYAYRQSENGATDSATSSGQNMVVYDTGGDANDKFDITYISNLAGNEKLSIGHGINRRSAGSGNAPVRGEFTWKWANTSNAITTINTLNDTNNQSGNFNTDSEVVVLGYDPTDTNTTDFWEELADVTLGSSATTLGTSTFTAKKYLWFQTYMKSGNCDYRLTFNGDSGSNYATRWSENGGSDSTSTSAAFNYLSPQGASTPRFTNTFMINNASNEKLGISHVALQNTAGAGNVPERDEVVHKWTNTSNQITSLTVAASLNTLSAGTRIKVWGSN